MSDYRNKSADQKSPLPAVALIIHDDQGNLIVSAPSIPGQLRRHWNLPEGLVRSGEDYLEAAVRVSREFTGSSAEPSGVYAVLSRHSPAGLETLSVVLLMRMERSAIQTVLSAKPDIHLVLSDSDLPFLDSLADTMLIRRFWSGEWSVVSKSQGFFSEGAGI